MTTLSLWFPLLRFFRTLSFALGAPSSNGVSYHDCRSDVRQCRTKMDYDFETRSNGVVKHTGYKRILHS
jgi:hypothetical protein